MKQGMRATVLVMTTVAVLAACGGVSEAGSGATAKATTSVVDAQAAAQAEASASAVAAEKAAADAAASAAAEAAAAGSVSQQNAYTKAKSYLAMTPFSRSGLAEQLTFEGFSAEDAEFAIARIETAGGVDWNAQAAAKAASYLKMTSFSHAGLVEQLTFEGFTPEQAEYGVSTTGL